MEKKSAAELQEMHKIFSVECFNRAWDFIDKPARTPVEDDRMLQLSLASLWHWTQRDDCTATNLSIGYWQVSRVFALMRQPEPARQYAQFCLEASTQEGVLPFQLGYAYEALARAEQVAGDLEAMEKHLTLANQAASLVTDQEDKKLLLKDLATIR